MRPRRELALGLGAFFVVGLLIVVQALVAPTGTLDFRLSTFRAEPSGARAWADALERLDVSVVRWRRPLSSLPQPPKIGSLLAVLAPEEMLGYGELRDLELWGKRGGDLLLVGRGNALAMSCAGWRLDTLGVEGLTGTARVGDAELTVPNVRARLLHVAALPAADSTRMQDVGVRQCSRDRRERVDTLLRASSGAVLAARVYFEKGGTVTLVADGALFTNKALRDTPAGEFTLSLVPPYIDDLMVDEYHHGFGVSSSLSGAILDWSTTHPWGWALWQAALVGVLALLVSMPRTGPIQALPRARRRSPLEHVAALARTLAATRGHDVAIVALVRGLRRRLSADGRPARDDPRAWLQGLAGRVRTDVARQAVARLMELTRPGRSAVDVLAAANAVEDVWQELRP